MEAEWCAQAFLVFIISHLNGTHKFKREQSSAGSDKKLFLRLRTQVAVQLLNTTILSDSRIMVE